MLELKLYDSKSFDNIEDLVKFLNRKELALTEVKISIHPASNKFYIIYPV